MNILHIRELLAKARQMPPVNEQIVDIHESISVRRDDNVERFVTKYVPAYLAMKLKHDIGELHDAIGPLLDRMEEMEADAMRYQWLRKNRGGDRSSDKPWAMIFDDDLEKYIDEQLVALRGEGE